MVKICIPYQCIVCRCFVPQLYLCRFVYRISGSFVPNSESLSPATWLVVCSTDVSSAEPRCPGVFNCAADILATAAAFGTTAQAVLRTFEEVWCIRWLGEDFLRLSVLQRKNWVISRCPRLSDASQTSLLTPRQQISECFRQPTASTSQTPSVSLSQQQLRYISSNHLQKPMRKVEANGNGG